MKTSQARNRFFLPFVAAACAAFTPTPATTGQDTAPAQAKRAYEHSAAGGVITGTISFEGEPLPRRFIHMDADPVCVEINPNPKTDDVVITEGKLAHVFVWIKSGSALDDYTFDPPQSPVTLEHNKCRYVPHVLGIQTGQPLKIVNADPTTHNTHPAPKANAEWNKSQAPGGEPFEEKFARPEVVIPFKCNQHPWEKAYVGVLSHPFFAVSGEDGAFRIGGLPPGDYTLAAWHEKLGVQEVKLTVYPYQSQVIDLTFRAETNPPPKAP